MRSLLRGLALVAPLVLLAALALASPAAIQQKLTAADGAAGDELGPSVAVDAHTLVLGAPSDDDRTGSVMPRSRA